MSQATTSSTMDSIKNGPMADKARAEGDKTKSELSNLAASRQTPSATTATGQNLTHYHSFFHNLLSWENPRATAISYASIVVFIFAARYLPIVRYSLKALYIVLGITAAAEVAGQTVMGQGVASKMRPKRYYTIPKEWLETMMEDLTELINFFVIEFQRIVFAENVGVTIGVSTIQPPGRPEHELTVVCRPSRQPSSPTSSSRSPPPGAWLCSSRPSPTSPRSSTSRTRT